MTPSSRRAATMVIDGAIPVIGGAGSFNTRGAARPRAPRQGGGGERREEKRGEGRERERKRDDAAIFNVIVGHADAHGKNFSLLHEDADVALAPISRSRAAGPLCTVGDEHRQMRLGRNRIPLRGRHSRPMPDLGAPFVRRRVKALADVAHRAVYGIAEQLAGTSLDGDALISALHRDGRRTVLLSSPRRRAPGKEGLRTSAHVPPGKDGLRTTR